MKNFLKFLLFVILLSSGISALYDYRIRHGNLGPLARIASGNYTLAANSAVSPQNIATLDSLNRERRTLVASVLPSVVSIKTSKRIPVRRQYPMDPYEFFNRGPRQYRNPNEEAQVQNSLGSGVIVSAEGHIITNNHVVDQVDEIEVQLYDGKTKKAKLVGADAQGDLAVLKIDAPNLKPMKLGDSDMVEPGDFVLAIGNPFGFEETVTDGIISSKGRPNRVDGFGDYLQTNAAINPGNSGGPLINLSGEVIGINTAIYSRSGGSQGIGFAIPSNTVRVAMEGLLKHGRIIRGYLGIQSRTTTSDQQGNGVLVDDVVPGSPAAQAKLQRGDVIKKFNGKDVRNFPELRSLVAQAELNKNIEIEVERNGSRVKVTTQLKEQPPNYNQPGNNNNNNNQQPQPTPRQQDEDNDNDNDNGNSGSGGALAGIQVGELTADLARQLNVPSDVRGVVVTSVSDDSGELRRGDVIEEIDQQPVPSVNEYNKITRSIDPNSTHVLSVCRRRTRSFVVIRPQ
jgi:serine protease Do